MENGIGKSIWERVELILKKYSFQNFGKANTLNLFEEPSMPLYGNSILTKIRIGQGAFRVLVTDAYSRRCSITGEKTLPVLEAAHIRPYSEAGPHLISNGILLRSDTHTYYFD